MIMNPTLVVHAYYPSSEATREEALRWQKQNWCYQVTAVVTSWEIPRSRSRYVHRELDGLNPHVGSSLGNCGSRDVYQVGSGSKEHIRRGAEYLHTPRCEISGLALVKDELI